MKEYLCIGQIVKPQGIKGELKVRPYTDDPQRFLGLERVWLGEGGTPVAVKSARLREEYAYITLESVPDRNAAESLRNVELYVDRANAVPLPEGRYFIVDLIGLAVEDKKGNPLGKLTDIAQAGGNDVYTVTGRQTFHFPATKRVILSVDIPGGKMTLDADALKGVAIFDD